MSATRLATTVVALVVLATLAVALRNTRLVSGALQPGADPQRSLRALDRAERLNPDPAPRIAGAFFLAATGRGAAARAVLTTVVADEPANLDAWRLLERVATPDAPAVAARARAAVRRLDPLGD